MHIAEAETEEKKTGCYRHTEMQRDLIIEKLKEKGLRITRPVSYTHLETKDEEKNLSSPYRGNFNNRPYDRNCFCGGHRSER